MKRNGKLIDRVKGRNAYQNVYQTVTLNQI